MAKPQDDPPCVNCGTPTIEDDRCPDGYCRACHVSVDFDECRTKTFNVRLLLESGAHSREELEKLYPDAMWDRI